MLPMVIRPCRMRCGQEACMWRAIARASEGAHPDFDSSPVRGANVSARDFAREGGSLPEVLTWTYTRSFGGGVLLLLLPLLPPLPWEVEAARTARPFSRASAFLALSTDSTAQRLGISSANRRHLFVCSWPMKCQSMSRGSCGAFSRSSASCRVRPLKLEER